MTTSTASGRRGFPAHCAAARRVSALCVRLWLDALCVRASCSYLCECVWQVNVVFSIVPVVRVALKAFIRHWIFCLATYYPRILLLRTVTRWTNRSALDGSDTKVFPSSACVPGVHSSLVCGVVVYLCIVIAIHDGNRHGEEDRIGETGPKTWRSTYATRLLAFFYSTTCFHYVLSKLSKADYRLGFSSSEKRAHIY